MLASTTSRRYDLIVLNSLPCFESRGSGVSDGESPKAVQYDLIVLNSLPCFESGGSGVSDGESLRAAHNILSSIFLDLDLCVLSEAVNAKAITVEENPDGDKRGEDTICDDERAMVDRSQKQGRGKAWEYFLCVIKGPTICCGGSSANDGSRTNDMY